MSARKIILAPTVFLLLLAFAVPAASRPTDSIVVNGADTIRTDSVSIDQGLVDSAATIGPRIVLEYANRLRHIGLTEMPSALQTALDQVSARIVTNYANTIRQDGLTAPPSQLGSLLVPVPDRVIFQYANRDREMDLAYPAELFDDNTPPQISDVSASGSTGIVTWTTDEFATSTVLYGVQTGIYTGTVSDALYVKQHEITLPGLMPETRYYYAVRSTDRSGNTATSSEYSFDTQMSVYLPVVVRNH